MTIEQVISNLKRAKFVPYKKETLAIAIKVLEETQNIHDKCMRCVEFSMFKPLPEIGRWVDGRCNRCGTHAPFWAMASGYYLSEYCPHCGAKMAESEETDADSN